MRDIEEHFDSIDEVTALVSRAGLFVTVVGTVFGVSFTYLLLTNIPYANIINGTGPHTLTRVALIIYYNGWIFAQPIEQGLMRRVYAADPYHGRIPKQILMVLPLLVAIGFLLILLQENERLLSIGLAVFYIIDIALWLSVRSLAATMKEASARVYNDAKPPLYVRLEQLNCYVDDYLRGSWQFFRYSVMGVFLIAMLVVIHVERVQDSVSFCLHALLPSVAFGTFVLVIPGALILAYVLLTELSSWRMRLRTRRTILLLNNLKMKYVFSRR